MIDDATFLPEDSNAIRYEDPGHLGSPPTPKTPPQLPAEQEALGKWRRLKLQAPGRMSTLPSTQINNIASKSQNVKFKSFRSHKLIEQYDMGNLLKIWEPLFSYP